MPVSEPESLSYCWALTGDLEHNPLIHLTLLKGVRGPDCVVFVVHRHQVLDNRVGFPDCVIVLMMVYQDRQSSVWTQSQKPWLFLIFHYSIYSDIYWFEGQMQKA